MSYRMNKAHATSAHPRKFRSLSVIHAFAPMVCMCGADFSSQLFAQPTSSIDVKSIAPESPEYMVKLATADDYREPAESAAIDTKPYDDSIPGRALGSGAIYHQPAGALTGKTIFAMAGHGWTYDADEMYYYTQRGLSHGMVEDLGNADQMHIFAHMLFNAGATVIPMKPVDHQPEERVLDNGMPQVEFYGKWRAGSADRYYGSAGDPIPYAVAQASLQESAIARYRPYIPKTGYYPVYVWARDGEDRTNQLYRIAHSGGQAEIRVNWRRVGKTWAWLGTYHFNEGAGGYVEVSNQVIDPYEAYSGGVVIADAVRFGNGRGDVPRPGGISGYAREDEGDSYWIERAMGVNASRQIFDVGRDGNSTISSPPKAAAHTNRELEGSYLDRALISFHSNASSGKARGAVVLYNASPLQRPTYQEALAELIGEELNTQMSAEKPPAAEDWAPRERHTYAGINFGELRRDYIQNEMCATIVETAFHDNRADVTFLLDPIARMQMAEATLRGLLRWYSEVIYPNSSYSLPPARPTAVAATHTDDMRIRVQWKTGAVGDFDGGPPATVRIYRSTDGYGFDGGQPFSSSAKEAIIDPLTTAGATFIRISAANSAGESFPSQTIAVGFAGKTKPEALLLSVNNVLDRTANIPYYLGAQPGGPYKDSAYTERVRSVYGMMEPAGASEAIALAGNGIAFNGSDTVAIDENLTKLKGYDRLFVVAGIQNPNTPLLSSKVIDGLRQLVEQDGKLYLSGTGLGFNLSNSGKKHTSFLRDIAGITAETTAPANSVVASTDDRFFSTTSTLTLSKTALSWAEEMEITPAAYALKRGRSIPLLLYEGVEAGAAALLTRPTSSEGEVVVLGFPLSLIGDPATRTALMAAILKQI